MNTMITLFLMFAMAVTLVALPSANAQSGLIMNFSGPVLLHQVNPDIDLNGGPGAGENVSLFVKYPGRTAFTYIWSGITSGSGDLDYYDFDFNESGSYDLKWALPPTFTDESNVVTVSVVTEWPPRQTYAFINIVPNPVGVGQEALLAVGITHPLALQPDGWEGITVTVTKPDDNVQTLGPFRTDSTGGTGTSFVPDQVGNYSLQVHFPEQTIPSSASAGGGGGSTPAGTRMLASDSVVFTLIVQEEPIQRYPGTPLPTEYWTRPIDSQLREWYAIAGSSLIPGRTNPRNYYLPYNDGPETAHVLWANTYTRGGQVGGLLGDPTIYTTGDMQSFEIGDAYEGKWSNPITVAGIGYFQSAEASVSSMGLPYTAVDLRTGEELWTKTFLDNRSITMGQLMYWDTYDFHGVYDYLIVTVGSTWYFFDSYTGNWHYTLTNVPSGTTVIGPKGEILRYNVNLNGGYMLIWNSTNIPSLRQSSTPGTMGWGQWRPFGKTINAVAPASGPGHEIENPTGLNGYQLNVTIPDLPGGVRAILDDRIIGSTIATGTQLDSITNWAISLKPGQEGQLLFNKTWTAPAEWYANGGNVVTAYEGSTNYGEDGVMIYGARELTKLYGFSTNTGDFLWETEAQIDLDPEAYLNWYGWTAFGERPSVVAYDKLITTGIGGIVYGYDVKTGELAWKYEAVDPYSEFLFGNNWWLFPAIVTDGKIYIGSLEHSPIDPRPRGAPFLALDIETGEEVFRVDGLIRQALWGGQAKIGDSVIFTQDTYSQRTYGIGKGPSATTVTASPKVSVYGSSVLVEGTVTDISPGTKDLGLTMRFPNGVPAVSDASMSEWMMYVYKQHPRPMNTAGVPIVLSVVDANGNYRDIGTTTSTDGFFSFKWQPDIEGQYTVYAAFEGSEAYYPSNAITSFVVDAAAATPAPTEAPAQSTADMYFVPAIAGLFVFVAIIGVVIILVLRKRP